MPSGDQVFRELQALCEEQRAAAQSAERRREELAAHSHDLVTQRGRAILELAKHYLPELSQENVESTFQGIQSDLRAIISRRNAQQQQLTTDRDNAREKAVQLDRQLAECTAQLSTQVTERERLAKQVAERLTNDTTFQQLSQQLLDAEAKLTKHEERVQELHQEAEQKLPAYQRSSLFQYLWKRKYGEAEYTGKGLIRQCDAWVGRLINFAQAKRGFEYLTQAPQLVQQEVERRRTELVPLSTQVQQMQRKVADEVGLTDVLRAGEELGRQRDELVHLVGEQREALKHIEHDLLQVTHTQGPHFDEALQRFREFLEKTELAVLASWAAATPSPHDDELVTQIQALTQELDRTRPLLEKQVQLENELEHYRDDLDFLLRRFQQANFDAPRSRFAPGLNLSGMLEQLRRGAMSRDEVWRQLQQGQEFEPTWVEESVRRGGRSSGNILDHPVTHVLMHAAVEVAGAALQAAVNSSNRRGGGGGGFSIPSSRPASSGSSSSSRPASAPSAAPRKRGFSTGDGF